MRHISIAIPTYNRFELLMQSFHCVLGDKRVNEIIIVDDHSSYEVYLKILEAVSDEPKVKLYRNEKNLDCYFNKQKAVSLCSNEWVILFDSDNIIDRDYIDRLYEFDEWQSDMIYAPDFAKPTFNYRAFAGLTIDRENVHSLMDRKMFSTCLNTCNFFINRYEYLKVWDGSVDPVTADSIYFNYCWLAAGNRIHITDNLSYIHRVHDHSHFKNNVHRTNGFDLIVEQKLRELR